MIRSRSVSFPCLFGLVFAQYSVLIQILVGSSRAVMRECVQCWCDGEGMENLHGFLPVLKIVQVLEIAKL